MSRQITFVNKVSTITRQIPAEQQWRAQDVNEIKEQHNALDKDVNGQGGLGERVSALEVGMTNSSETKFSFAFAAGTAYDLDGAAKTGKIEFLLANAKLGSKVYFKHNDASAPAINTDLVLVNILYEGPGSSYTADYTANQDNYFEAELLSIRQTTPLQTMTIKLRYVITPSGGNDGTRIIDTDGNTSVDVGTNDQINMVSAGTQIMQVYKQTQGPRIRFGDYLAESSGGYVDLVPVGPDSSRLDVNVLEFNFGQLDNTGLKGFLSSTQFVIQRLTVALVTFAQNVLRLPVPATRTTPEAATFNQLLVQDSNGDMRKVSTSDVGTVIPTSTSGHVVRSTGTGYAGEAPNDIYSNSLTTADLTNLRNDVNWNSIGAYTGTATTVQDAGTRVVDNTVAYTFEWDGTKWTRLMRG